jgi:peptidase E
MKRERRQIIALGGGGFSMELENLALDVYVLQQAGKPNPSVCFVPTATGCPIHCQLLSGLSTTAVYSFAPSIL